MPSRVASTLVYGGLALLMALIIFVRNYPSDSVSYCQDSTIEFKSINGLAPENIAVSEIFSASPGCSDYSIVLQNPLKSPYTVLWSESRITSGAIDYFVFVNPPDVSMGLPIEVESNSFCQREFDQSICEVNKKLRQQYSRPTNVEPNSRFTAQVLTFYPIVSRGKYGKGPAWTAGTVFSSRESVYSTLSIIILYLNKRYKISYTFSLNYHFGTNLPIQNETLLQPTQSLYDKPHV